MTLGYIYMILSLTSFGFIGIFAKIADIKGCKPRTTYTFAYIWSALFCTLAVFLFRGGHFAVPWIVYKIAIPFGAISVVGGMVFMAGIRYGKISTSWLIINLSAAVPAIGSVLLYHEPISPRKMAILALTIVSVVLLWKDKQTDEARKTAMAREVGA